jgi:hypothetical protein
MDMNRPALNPTILNDLNAIKPGLAAELAEEFFGHTPRVLAALRMAVAMGNRPAVHRHARDLRDSSAIFGAIHLVDLCRAALHTVDLLRWLSQVEVEYARVAQELKAVMS